LVNILVQVEVIQEVAKRRAGGSVKADFAQFPSKEVTKVRCCVKSLRHASLKPKYKFQRNLIVMAQYVRYLMVYSAGACT
jgi:LDH2 family malate/lactate/ureidoglycolate dehydrogenase